MGQLEIKIVMWQPTDGHFAADIYLKRFDPTQKAPEDVMFRRIHCGAGCITQKAAMDEALEQLSLLNQDQPERRNILRLGDPAPR